MGTVAKQASWNAIFIFIGVFFGAINNVFVLPNAFENFKEGWAFLGLILSIAFISSHLFSFSAHSVFINNIPKLDTQQKKNDLVSLVLLGCAIGVTLFGAGFYLFKDFILSRLSPENAELIDDYYISVLILAAALISFNAFSGFVVAKFKTVQLTILQDSFTKISYLGIALAYLWGWVSFSTVVWLYVSTYVFMSLVAFLQARMNGLRLGSFRKVENIKEVLNYAFYLVLDKGAGVMLQRIDTIMIIFILDLAYGADYMLAFFIGSVVYIPFKSMLNIVNPIASKEIGLGNFKKLSKTYKRVTLYGVLLGGYIFIGVWTNVDSLLLMLPDKFRTGAWVILFIGLSKMVQLLSGISGAYIVYSKYYKFNLRLNVILLVMSILTNFILIWRYGINGAAAATALSILIYCVIKVGFVYKKFDSHPFSMALLKLLAVQLLCVILFILIPAISETPIIEIIIKSLLFSAVYLMAVRVLKIVPEVSSLSNLKLVLKGQDESL